MIIPIFDPKRHYKQLHKQFLSATERVLSSGTLVLGGETQRFEKEFAKFCGTKYAVMVNSGTSALLASLLAYQIGENDEVITVPNSFAATAQAIVFCRAKPVFCDIDPKTYNIDPNKLEKVITKKTKAIIVVHLYGQPAEMRTVLRIARKYNLVVIEDSAQAHGGRYLNKTVGNLGHAGCFSFFVTKNLPSFGTSGIITTNNKHIATKLKILRDNGMIEKGSHILSLNFMPEELQAAYLRIKLKALTKWNLRRRKISYIYKKHLKKLPIILPYENLNSYHVYYQFVIRTLDRAKLQSFLKNKGIQTRIYYPIPNHLQPGFKYLGYQKGDFKQAEKAAKEILSLPMYPELTDKEIFYIIKGVKNFFGY